MEKTLIILTSGYPYGIYDDFLDNELKFLKTKFKKIHFIVPEYSSNLKLRELDFEYSITKVKKISKIKSIIKKKKKIAKRKRKNNQQNKNDHQKKR